MTEKTFDREAVEFVHAAARHGLRTWYQDVFVAGGCFTHGEKIAVKREMHALLDAITMREVENLQQFVK